MSTEQLEKTHNSKDKSSRHKEPSSQDQTNSEDHRAATTTTLFISKLDPSIDSAKLLELSSAIGPVKEAFVVLDPASSKSRGFGYVRFVLREDAELAIKDGLPNTEQNHHQPLLTWAKPKLTPEQKSQKSHQNGKKIQHKTKAAPHPPKSIEIHQVKDTGVQDSSDVQLSELSSKQKKDNSLFQIKKDPFANRILVLQGLPIPPTTPQEPNPIVDESEPHQEIEQAQSEADDQHPTSEPEKSITTKALYKRAKKLGKLESVDYPVLFPPSQTSASAHLIFADPTSAAIAQKKLHGHIFKGYYLTSALKSRLDALTRLGHAFGGRLIIRNLQFDITEQDLRYLFAPFGSIHSIDIPTTTPIAAHGKSSSSRGRGFAFVWMMLHDDAKRAMEGLNGKRIFSGICQENIRKEIDGSKKSVKRKREKASDSNNERGRLIAVDWALGKQKYEEAQMTESHDKKDDMSIDQENNNHNDDKSSASSGSEDEHREEKDDDDDDGENHSDDSSMSETNTSSSFDEHRSQDEMDIDDVDHNKSNDHNDNQGTTLFVRNLSFEATEQELHKLFRPFGPIRYARIVMDPQLGRSRGTGFVCLWNREDAQRVLDLVKKIESEGAGHGPLAANGLPSLLQPDPSSSLASQLSLHGRILGVSQAVSRDQAEKLRIDRDKSGEGKDKRRLYLMREGVIFPNSNEAQNLHPTDLAARQQAFDQRKALLRSNLSLYISYTRLSIRQLPLYVSERTLKRLARHALAQWRKEVKAGTRMELTQEELERELQVQPTKSSIKNDQTSEALSKADKKKKKGIHSKVTQVKILRTHEKIDPSTGLGKSKGYGFIELDSHQNALRVLRWANANSSVDKLLKEWTIEEIQTLIKTSETSDNHDPKSDSNENPKKSSKKNHDNDKNKIIVKPNARTLNNNNQINKLKVKLNELQSELDSLKKWSHKTQKESTPGEKSESGQTNKNVKPHRMLIIEFAIENAQTVKKRLERKEKSQRRFKTELKKGDADEIDAEEGEKGGKEKRQRKGRGMSSLTSSSKSNRGFAQGDDEKNEGNNRIGRIISLKRKHKKLQKK